MRSVNKVILIGNVTRDPEIRHTQGGQTVCTFGLATNRDWITSDGRRKASSEYHELVAWAQLADICEKYVRKGKLLYIEGYLKTRSWDTPEGIRKFKTEIVIQDMIMLEKKKHEGGDEFVGSENGGNGDMGDGDGGGDGGEFDESMHGNEESNRGTAESSNESSSEPTNASPAKSDDDEHGLIEKDLGL